MGLNGELRRYCAEILSERDPSYRSAFHGALPNLFDARASTQRGFSEVVRLPVGGIPYDTDTRNIPFDLVLEEASIRTVVLLLTSFEQNKDDTKQGTGHKPFADVSSSSTEFDDRLPVSGQDKVVSEAK